MPHRTDMERVQERAALVELQKRVSGKGCAGSTTVIEALFPDIPVRKRTESEKAEIERWFAVRREAGLKIDPETAALGQDWGDAMDPYCVWDKWRFAGASQQDMAHTLELIAQRFQDRHASLVRHVKTAGVIMNVDGKKRLMAS